MSETQSSKSITSVNVLLTDLSFTRKPKFDAPPNDSVNVEFEVVASVPQDLHKVQCALSCHAYSEVEKVKQFELRAKIVGLFEASNVSKEELTSFATIAAPSILMPYVREIISNTTLRAGMKPVLIHPINFQALAAQGLIKQTQDESKD